MTGLNFFKKKKKKKDQLTETDFLKEDSGEKKKDLWARFREKKQDVEQNQQNIRKNKNSCLLTDKKKIERRSETK